jgi:hypothetical protein
MNRLLDFRQTVNLSEKKFVGKMKNAFFTHQLRRNQNVSIHVKKIVAIKEIM